MMCSFVGVYKICPSGVTFFTSRNSKNPPHLECFNLHLLDNPLVDHILP